ncbi:hypothetical protein FFLO_00972 [Filobasidium floriforme]|uniref:PH domain-containing protein n=1 Tax=Filobasidium floriforme TaxID=5210 RepID=A0A8K0JQL2_9TREE|nr:hypothetical protein FFLO_00972 [Filobasidium floriforme]
MSHYGNNNDDAMSRTTSISRRQGSTMSKNQSLIKKNTAPHELKPSDILIDRFTAWKNIVKMLISYFEGVADIEANTSKELTKLGAVIQVPFRHGNQFLGEGGVQDVFYTIRDKTRVIAESHSSLARTIDSSIVQHLQKLRTEIKAHIKNVQNDTGKLAAGVAKEREMSTKAIADLARAIGAVTNTPMSVSSKEDPFAVNLAVHRQLQKQVNEENALQKSVIIMQQNSAHFEEGIVRSIQSAWQTFDEWQSRMSTSVQETWRHMGVTMAQVVPEREWVSFAARSDHLLDPETPLRNPDMIDYPGKNDPSVQPVHVGLLERKKRFTKSYKEGYYVLTPSGYLHEYASSDPSHATHPVWSLFLPACTLGPPSSPNTTQSHKFHIEGRKDGTSAYGKTPSHTGSLFKMGKSETAYTFRARSHDEMMEWWNDVRMLVARYLVASEQMERDGPVAQAVRTVGYRSEDEEDEEEEDDDGSSVEEEDEEEHVEEHHHQQGSALGSNSNAALDLAPAYTQPAAGSGVQTGSNGYALEKKLDDGKAGSIIPDGGSAAGLSRREEKAPLRDSANESTVSQSTTTGKHATNNIVLGAPKTEGMGEAATSDVNVHSTNGGETVTQAPASEQAHGTETTADESEDREEREK